MTETSLEKKYSFMTCTPVPKLICKLAFPTMISMLITTFYNMADTFFVGKLDTESVGAVGVAFSAMAIIQAVGFMFGNGSGNCLSRQLGRKQNDEAEKTASTGFFSSIIIGLVLAVLGLIFLEKLSYVLGSTDTILPYTKKYLGVVLCAAPLYIGSLSLNCQLRMQGNASLAMIGIVSGGVLNLILDPILIFTFDMGITGAAFATAISQIASFFILLIMITRGNAVKIRLRSFSPSFHRYIKILGGGAPSFLRQGITSFAVILLNHAAGVHGDAAIAGMAITSRVVFFANAALIGFGQGFQPVCAFNYGAKLYDRVREGFWFSVKYGFAFLVFVAILLGVFAPEVAGIFRKGDAEVVAVASSALRWQVSVFPLNTWTVMVSMMLQTMGKSLRASILAICRQGIFFIPLILILPYFFGLKGVLMCQFWSDILTMSISLWFGIKTLRELKIVPDTIPDTRELPVELPLDGLD